MSTIARCARGWNEFFHAPVDPRIPALVRIAYSLVLLANLANYYPHLERWFGESGVLPLEIAEKIADPTRWTLFAWLPADEFTLYACFYICALQTVLLLVGCLSRFQAACLFVWLISYQHRNTLIHDGQDTVLRLLPFFLMLMPCGAAWSLDALIFRRAPHNWLPVGRATNQRLVSGWGLRLLQLQIALIFLSAGICKLQGPAWLDGTALYYVMRLNEFGKYPLPAWILETPWIVRGMTWSVIAIELIAPLLVWFPKTRRATLMLVLVFHLANEYSMHLLLFHWVMLAGWLAFVKPADWEWLTRQRDMERTADFADGRG